MPSPIDGGESQWSSGSSEARSSTIEIPLCERLRVEGFSSSPVQIEGHHFIGNLVLTLFSAARSRTRAKHTYPVATEIIRTNVDKNFDAPFK